MHGIHPAVAVAGLGITFWFLAVIALTFGRDQEIGYLIAVALFFSIVFFSLALLTGSYAVVDSRWQLRRTTFVRFLRSRVAIDTGRLWGRHVLVQILTLPASLALAVTVLGLIWTVVNLSPDFG